MSLVNMKRELVQEQYPDWEVTHDGMFYCPCGHRVEDDGSCPNGHESPLKQNGL